MSVEPETYGDRWLRPASILGLVAGRATYRVAAYGAGIVLLAIWGAHTFAVYATAVGATGWVLNLVGGTEKAAQTLLPRQPARELERFFVLAAVVPYAALVLGWIAASVAVPSTVVPTYLAAAALAGGIGAASAVVALFRMRGRPGLDALTYVHLSLGYVIGVIAVGWLSLDVRQLLAVLLVWQLSAVALLAARLRTQRIGTGSAAGQRWEALRAIPLLSAADLASAVAAAVLYVEVNHQAGARAVSTFYVAAVVITVVAMVWVYLLRLFQPGLVRRLAAGEGRRAVGLARRVSAVVAGVGGLATAALASLAGPIGESLVLLGPLVVLEPMLFVGTSFCTFVLENIGAHGRRRAAAAAISEVVAVVAVGAALVPHAGATGALVALCAGQAVKSAVLVVLLPRP